MVEDYFPATYCDGPRTIPLRMPGRACAGRELPQSAPRPGGRGPVHGRRPGRPGRRRERRRRDLVDPRCGGLCRVGDPGRPAARSGCARTAAGHRVAADPHHQSPRDGLAAPRERGQRRSEPQLRGSRRRQLPGERPVRGAGRAPGAEGLDDDAYERYKAAIGALNDRYGEVPVRKAMHKGQYRHPDSIHYGGGTATWSNRTLGRICGEFLGAARRGAMIDVHTGLGPYGYGELMTPEQAGRAGLRPVLRLVRRAGAQHHRRGLRLRRIQGQHPGRLQAAGGGPGMGGGGVGVRAPGSASTLRRCMLANAWLHAHGELDSDLGRAIKRDVKDASYPGEEKWKTMVWERGREVVEIALRRIGA